MSTGTDAAAHQGATKQHPRGLYVLFAAEAWERFSYYGMRALLVLYMTKHLKFERAHALQIYALYTGLVYLTPLFGGILADKLLGRRKAVIIGGILMMLGHLAMASEPLLYTALGLLIIGNGFFKPNISTIVGGLYEEGDSRRDAGFTIFYMGINLGALFSPLVAGTLGEKIGWHVGFSAAAVGMAFGLGVFLWGQRLLGTVGFPPGVKATAETRLGAKDWRDIGIFVAAGTALVVAAIQGWKLIEPTWSKIPLAGQILIALGLITAAIWLPGRLTEKKGEDSGAQPFTTEEWHRIAVILLLVVFNIFFWVGFEQAGGTMTLFADEQTDRHVGTWEMPASYFQAINPLLIVVLAPLFSAMWKRIDRSPRYALSTPTKMALGLIILGLGFVVMYYGQKEANVAGKVGIQWLLTVYAIHTVGELCLSPIGLSMVTKLSPVRIVSLMMGFWFLSSAVANYSAGILEDVLKRWSIPIYGFLFVVPIGAGVLLLALTPLIKKWMHGADDTREDAPETDTAKPAEG